MTNKFTFETTDVVLASAIFDLINGGGKPAKARGSTRAEGEAVKDVAAPVATAAPIIEQAAPAAEPATPAAVLATPQEAPVTSDQLMKALSDFLAKFGHDAAKAVFAKHQAPPSISALVAESAEKARAVFNDFTAQLNA